MPHWPFVIAAYGITALATLATSLWAWRSARQAETRADQLTSQRGGRD